VETTAADILDVDLLAFETGTAAQRAAVVDGTRRSLANGFVYTAHDLSSDLLDAAYAMLGTFFGLPAEAKERSRVPGSHGQSGYTGLLVETAASSDHADWKEMLNWGGRVPAGHPLRARFPHRYGDPVFPEADVPGISEVLLKFHDSIVDLQRRFLRVIAVAVGAHEHYFDSLVEMGANLTRAIQYPPMQEAPGDQHVWAAAHGDINLTPPDGHVIINTGMMLERVTNGLIPAGIHRVVADPDQPGGRLSVVQFCHPTPWTILDPLASCVTPDNPQRYAPIAAADALDEVLWQINLVEDVVPTR